MNSILTNLVLRNNPDLYVHAARIEAGLIPNRTGDTIVVFLSERDVPEGMKVKGGYRFYKETTVLGQDDYNLETPFLTEYGWKQDSKERPSVLIPKEGVEL